MKEKISNGIKYLNFSIWMVASLLVFLSVGMLFALFIAQSISINASTMGLLNLSFLIILVFVTTIYAFSTWQIVDEQRKSKKIDDIEKQLEKLYYPLMDILKNPRASINKWGAKIDVDFYIDLKKIDDIIPFQHLVSDDLKDLLEKFIDNSLKGRIIGDDNNIDGTNFGIIDKDFRELIKEDIERLKEELQLIKNS